MPYGLNRGRGAGSGRGYGRGFGFRGTSPAWPYIGRGRGGLPRCGYFFREVATVPPQYTPAAPVYAARSAAPDYSAKYTSMSKEEELNYMKNQAETIKEQLEQIDKRMRDLEAEK